MDSNVGRIAYCDDYFAKWELEWCDLRKARRYAPRTVQSPYFDLETGTSFFSIQVKLPSPDCEITYVLKLVSLSPTCMLRPVQLLIGGISKRYESEWFYREPRLEFQACYITKDALVICCEIGEVVSTEDSSIEELKLEDLSIAQRISSTEETKVEEEDTPRSKSTAKLIGDLKDILISQKDSDVVLKVKDREFKAHRLILGMRSPVFSAMFEHEMKEKNTGVVAIEDCDQAIFPDFLHYIYMGTVEKLSSENAPGLYVAADKYQLLELKEECLDYMKRKVSVENFCDFVTVSLRHHERELTEIATEFFLEKAADIIVTTKWMTFLAENVVVGNELFVKFASNRGTK